MRENERLERLRADVGLLRRRLRQARPLGEDRRARGVRLGPDEVARISLEARRTPAGERRRRAQRRTLERPDHVRRELLGRGDLALGLFGEPFDVARCGRRPRVSTEHLDGVVDRGAQERDEVALERRGRRVAVKEPSRGGHDPNDSAWRARDGASLSRGPFPVPLLSRGLPSCASLSPRACSRSSREFPGAAPSLERYRCRAHRPGRQRLGGPISAPAYDEVGWTASIAPGGAGRT